METLGESKVFSFSVSSVNKGTEAVGLVPDCLLYPQGWKTSPWPSARSVVYFTMSEMFLND